MRSLISAFIATLLLWSPAQADQELPYAPPSARIETRPDGPSQREIDARTRVVMLGTGTPIPDAYRAGSSIAVVHRGYAYLFDVGPGAVRNAVRARYKYDLPALYPSQIRVLFLTHLHSDHTLDYVELAYTLWWRRDQALMAFGPRGLRAMTDGMQQLMAGDVAIRTSGNQPVPIAGNQHVRVQEIDGGFRQRFGDLEVEAFDVPHGDVEPAFGFRVTTPDLKIVISGDTAFSQTLAKMSRGADYLFHEVISDSGLAKNSPAWQAYHKSSHTLASDVGKLAQAAGVKQLVLYHGLYYGTEESSVVREAKQYFDGPVILASDLDTFD